MANPEFPVIPVTVERVDPPIPPLPKDVFLSWDGTHWTAVVPMSDRYAEQLRKSMPNLFILCLQGTNEKARDDELALMRGAMDAQDKREIDAGAKCEVPWEEHGCDWPDKVADVVLGLRGRKLKLEKMLREMEWQDRNDGISKYCPVCLETRHHGHTSDCRLAAVLTQ